MAGVSIAVSVALKSSPIIGILSISPFRAANIYLVCLGVLMSGAYIFINVVFSCWIDLVTMSCPSLRLIIVFALKSILSAVTFFRFPFALTVSPSLHVQSVPASKVSLL